MCFGQYRKFYQEKGRGALRVAFSRASYKHKKPNHQQDWFRENPQNFPDHEAHKISPPRGEFRGQIYYFRQANQPRPAGHRKGARLTTAAFYRKTPAGKQVFSLFYRIPL
jgi:hypothetical protein